MFSGRYRYSYNDTKGAAFALKDFLALQNEDPDLIKRSLDEFVEGPSAFQPWPSGGQWWKGDWQIAVLENTKDRSETTQEANLDLAYPVPGKTLPFLIRTVSTNSKSVTPSFVPYRSWQSASASRVPSSDSSKISAILI